VIAFAVPRTGETVHETEIFALCASRLAGYKCPAELHVVGQLPMRSWTASHYVGPSPLKSNRRLAPVDRVPAGSAQSLVEGETNEL